MVEIKSQTPAPSNVEQQEKAVVDVQIGNKALGQTVESVKSLSQGEIPSNEQLISSVEQTKETIEKTSKYLTTESAQNIKERALNLLDVVKQLIEEKNEDEPMQKFVFHFNKFVRKYSSEVSSLYDQVQTEQVGYNLYESVQRFNDFLFELFRSTEFRNLMVDTITYLRVLTRKNLQNIDVNSNESLRDAFQRLVSTFEPSKKESLVSEKASLTQPSWQTSSATQKTITPVSKDVEMKDVERLEDRLYDRFKELLREFSNNDSYRDAVYGFLSVFDELKSFFKETVGEEEKPTSKYSQLYQKMRNDEHFKALTKYGKEMLIQWTGDEKLINDLKQSLNDIYRDFSQDRELNQLVYDLEKDIRRFLKDPELIDKESDRVKNNLKRLRNKLNEKTEMDSIDRFNNYFNRALEVMKNDELIQNINEQSRELLSDLFLDAKGNFQFKPQTLDELRLMFVSMIKETVESISDLDIHFIDDTIEYKLSGLQLKAADILPSHIRLSGHSITNIDYSEENLANSLSGTKSILILDLSGIVCHFKNVNFWFQRFSFPKLQDEGLLDIDTGDKGLTINLRIRVDTSSRSELFVTQAVKVEIDSLSLTFTKAENHELLLRLLSPIIESRMKNSVRDQIQTLLWNQEKVVFSRLNQMLEQLSESVKSGKKMIFE